jgi:GNAT superfamily N-acetyltransferase
VNAGSRLLTSADVNAVADVLSQAFLDDPLCAFILPNRRTRINTLRKFFRPYGQISIMNGRGFGVGKPLHGVAFWEFPEQGSVSINIRSLFRFLPLLFSSYPIGLYRARAITAEIDSLHSKHADEPHFYLDNIGVLAQARGQGVSSQLIRPVLALADSQNVIAYTDTVTAENVPLYEHFGFQCVAAKPVDNTDITVYALRRPIQRSSDQSNP